VGSQMLGGGGHRWVTINKTLGQALVRDVVVYPELPSFAGSLRRDDGLMVSHESC
jgi:hypothetical protein